MSVDVSNPNQRTPCVLVLDASGSMNTRTSTGRTRLEELNAGIQAFESALRSDDAALGRVQVAIVIVGGPADTADVMMDWTDAVNFSAFPLKSGGQTPLGKGVVIALDLVEHVKRNLNAAGISYTRPWIMIVSDGGPTDQANDWAEAVRAARAAELTKKAEIFSIGVEGADLAKLGELAARPPIKLAGMKFKELFVWLSSSLSAASRSRPGEAYALPPTDPWKNVGI